MSMKQEYATDIQNILAAQHSNGGAYWTTADGGIAKGTPFSTLETGIMLGELGYDPRSAEMVGIAEAIFRNLKNDGRIRAYSSGAIYPCHTAGAARTLCRLGYSSDPRLAATYEQLLATQHDDGGWRCNASKFGHGPETQFSNPGPTLTALDSFRFTDRLNADPRLDRAIDFLLRHWETKLPLGPCHYGIGTLFMKIEYPMFRYNLFHYVYTLSFYDASKNDPRFREALGHVARKLVDGKLTVESINKKLSSYRFCAVGPNDLATARYREILKNLES